MSSDIIEKILQGIKTNGLSIIPVGADQENNDPPFCYSIGIALVNRYELYIEKAPAEFSAYTIREIFDTFRKKEIEINHSCFVRGLYEDDMPIALVEVDDESLKTTKTLLLSDIIDPSEFSLLQIVLSDGKGVFPWEEGFDDSIGEQKIYRKDPSKQALQQLMKEAPAYRVNPLDDEDEDPTLH